MLFRSGILASWRAQRAQKQAAQRAKAHSDAIDSRIHQDSKNPWRKCIVLLMGPGTSAFTIQFLIRLSRSCEFLYRAERSSPPTLTSKDCMYRYADFIFALGHNNRDTSTIIEQLKIMYQNGDTYEERMEFRLTIWKNLLETARCVVQVLRALHSEPETFPSKVRRFRVAIFRYIMGSLRQTGSAL